MKLFKKRKYNIAIFGADGMLGYDVVKYLNGMQLQKNSCVGVVTAFSRDVDISKYSCLSNALSGHKYCDRIKYDIAVNCVAMTDVNKIETDKEYRDKAYKANVIGPTKLAMICKSLKMKLVHISTDYVYSEKSAQDWMWPVEHNNYTEMHAFQKNNSIEWPVNIYGMQKLLAEQSIQQIMPRRQYAILRTSWLYGMHNNKSFVHKFLKNFFLWKKERDAGLSSQEFFTLPHDQVSVPTLTSELAQIIYCTIDNKLHGVLPACGFYSTKLGLCYAPSWFDFGQQILFEYDDRLLEYLKPVQANDPTKPKFSRMLNVPCNMHEKFYGQQFPSMWTEQLRWFINVNRQEIVAWLKSQGCFDEPAVNDP